MLTVVLGGYGNFGARICRALAGNPGIELVVAGRSQQRAAALAAELGHGTRGLYLNVNQPDLADDLREMKAELVIHAAGPFQQQGYAVAQAAAAAGAHYIDLADARRFVCDFPAALDAAFRAAGRVGISGASTLPALSNAALDHLILHWQALESIDVCIAPAQSAPRGEATMAAVLDYCGAPIQVWKKGQWTTQYGWSRPRRVRFARLRSRLGALCDVPDLELFPLHYKGVQSVMFRAALEVGICQRALAIMGLLRRLGLLRQPVHYAAFLNRSANGFDFLGSGRGGMVVRAAGVGANGQPVQHAWHVMADDDSGPEIPCMAAILLARRLARGEVAKSGATTSIGWLRLADFAGEFAKWGMQTDVVDETRR
ncbi:MAG: saccharopine dehydrogenase NADP-binding domain-containing protein [Pseudomonadota bacterium]